MTLVDQHIAAMRRFNRFYTRQIGLLNEGLLESPFSLTEVRTLYELAQTPRITAVELRKTLGLDAGYLSRMLAAFEKSGLIQKQDSESDGRRSLLSLTTKGAKAFAPLDARSSRQVGAMLSRIPPVQQDSLLAAMRTIETILSPEPARPVSYLLRQHRPGDMGWVVQRHGELYWREYHYDERFEALVAEIVGEFIQNLDSHRERCWIAEKDGENVGSVFLVKKSASVAKLRLLLVEPTARGFGIGKRLVEECVRFAREAGYKKVLLWTQSELSAARGIYQATGFRRIAEERHDSWSRKNLVSETWELKL
jgi:DNA-binding MarR family transcriptional regulator/N-acetylglutamate synthase-like GNAT family acetyltransferase